MRTDQASRQTARLILRPPRIADIPALFAFLGDPAAMRFTYRDNSFRACRRRILVHEGHRRRDGCAPWVAIRREDDRIIGWGGAYHDPFDPGWGCEIGYHLHPDVWGQGYASELTVAALSFARDVLRLSKICAFAHPDNAASRRVLTKAGFRELRHIPQMNRILHERAL